VTYKIWTSMATANNHSHSTKPQWWHNYGQNCGFRGDFEM